MKGLDEWITGHYGEDQYGEPCISCEEEPQYKRGLCRDCWEAAMEAEADRQYDIAREDRYK